MKIAFHFDSDHSDFEYTYGFPIQDKIFSIILNHRSLNIHTKIFVGDLLLTLYSMDIKGGAGKSVHTFNKRRYMEIFNSWQSPENYIWRRYTDSQVEASIRKNIYVVCFESIDLNTAEYINSQLVSYSPYLGAMEVDETSKTHWMLYSQALIALGRLNDKTFSLFHQQDDEIEGLLLDDYKEIPFKNVNLECLNYRYTIFDNYSGYGEARRIAEWKRNSGALLAFVADDIVSKLSDIAPDVGTKLWSALKTFEQAETNEQLAQVTASCRRIFEYVTDQIFPASNDKIDGHSLKADKYKNRLFAYADQARNSNTNIDLIVASTKTLFEQWEKLNNLSNKGVHSEVNRSETRRCLLRTIMLLDDIVSLKSEPFKINIDFKDIFGL